jgi:hypothetical protein
MSQPDLPLLARTDRSRADEDVPVRIAWALDGGRPVHIARYSHLRDGAARPELACLGCHVPVVPVLPPVRRGRPGRQDHFRHKQASPRCWADHGEGARLWNATLHLHRALGDIAGTPLQRRLRVHAPCDPASGPWSGALPLFGTHCPASRALPLPPWDTLRLAPSRRRERSVPAIELLHDGVVVLALQLLPAGSSAPEPLLPPGPPLPVQVDVDGGSYPRLVRWDPSRDPFPATRAGPALTWRCPRHR